MGRNARTPPAISSSPAGILSQRPDGWRRALTTPRTRFGSRSINASRRQSSLGLRRVQTSSCVEDCSEEGLMLCSLGLQAPLNVPSSLRPCRALATRLVAMRAPQQRKPATEPLRPPVAFGATRWHSDAAARRIKDESSTRGCFTFDRELFGRPAPAAAMCREAAPDHALAPSADRQLPIHRVVLVLQPHLVRG